MNEKRLALCTDRDREKRYKGGGGTRMTIFALCEKYKSSFGSFFKTKGARHCCWLWWWKSSHDGDGDDGKQKQRRLVAAAEPMAKKEEWPELGWNEEDDQRWWPTKRRMAKIKSKRTDRQVNGWK